MKQVKLLLLLLQAIINKPFLNNKWSKVINITLEDRTHATDFNEFYDFLKI